MTTCRQTFIPPSGGNINRRRSYWIWSNQKKSYSWAEERKTRNWTTMSQDLNNTMNGTQLLTCYYWNLTARKIGTTFAYCLIFLVALAGNTAIGIIVYKTKTMRKPINFLIVNVAMSDLLFPIFWIPQDIQSLYINSWLIGGPLGQALCKLVNFWPYASVAVSIQSLALIAVDRFGAVVFPLRSPVISSKLCPFFILATWIIAMAVLSPYLFAYKLVEYPGGLVCALSWKEVFGESSYENYFASILMIFHLIPLMSIAILYIIIYIKLKSQKTPGEQSANAGQQRQQRERNVLKMTITIVLGFAVCWLPYCIYWFHFLFAPDIWSCGFLYFHFFAILMTRVSCAMNPCICFIFCKNYRTGLKNLFG